MLQKHTFWQELRQGISSYIHLFYNVVSVNCLFPEKAIEKVK
jgi:hypothetical protein